MHRRRRSVRSGRGHRRRNRRSTALRWRCRTAAAAPERCADPRLLLGRVGGLGQPAGPASIRCLAWIEGRSTGLSACSSSPPGARRCPRPSGATLRRPRPPGRRPVSSASSTRAAGAGPPVVQRETARPRREGVARTSSPCRRPRPARPYGGRSLATPWFSPAVMSVFHHTTYRVCSNKVNVPPVCARHVSYGCERGDNAVEARRLHRVHPAGAGGLGTGPVHEAGLRGHLARRDRQAGPGHKRRALPPLQRQAGPLRALFDTVETSADRAAVRGGRRRRLRVGAGDGRHRGVRERLPRPVLPADRHPRGPSSWARERWREAEEHFSYGLVRATVESWSMRARSSRCRSR